jgi:hypothetical protein
MASDFKSKSLSLISRRSLSVKMMILSVFLVSGRFPLFFRRVWVFSFVEVLQELNRFVCVVTSINEWPEVA